MSERASAFGHWSQEVETGPAPGSDESYTDGGAMPPQVGVDGVRWAHPSWSDRQRNPDIRPELTDTDARSGENPYLKALAVNGPVGREFVDRSAARLSPAQAELARVLALDGRGVSELLEGAGGGETFERAPVSPVTGLRDESGVPASPEHYDLELGSGYVVGEEDKPLVDDFLRIAHRVGLTQDQNKEVLRSYYAATEKVSQARAAEDERIRDEAAGVLGREWGSDFKENVGTVNRLMDQIFGAAMRKEIFEGRLGNGTPVGSSPHVLRGLLRLARAVGAE